MEQTLKKEAIESNQTLRANYKHKLVSRLSFLIHLLLAFLGNFSLLSYIFSFYVKNGILVP